MTRQIQDYDDDTCYRQLSQAGKKPVCTQIPNMPHHCQDYMAGAIHADCMSAGNPYYPVQIPTCVQYVSGVPTNYKYFPSDVFFDECDKLVALKEGWRFGWCFCCCACMAYGTQIALPDGKYKVIQDIAKGEEILTASLESGKLTWNPAKVTFSAGAGGGGDTLAVYVGFARGGEASDLVCTPDQVFMLAGGKLVTASRLRVGDKLTGRDGEPVEVSMVATGFFRGGLHHVATAQPDPKGANGHLILAGGVVVGDYYLQLKLAKMAPGALVEDFEKRPEIGTPEYAEGHAGSRAGVSFLFGRGLAGGPRSIQMQSGRFEVYQGVPSYPAERAASLFTDAQALDILGNGEQLPVSNTIPKADAEQLFAIFSGFYPDVDFYLDWFDFVPNLRAFERYGRKFVVVSGGLARMKGFQIEGLAMAIAHGVGRLLDVAPTGADGYSGTGTADWVGFGTVSRTVFLPMHWMDDVTEAYRQVEALMSLIDPKHAGGDPLDPVNHPSIACRLRAMGSAIGGGSLPECCGGAPLPTIELEALTGDADGFTLTLSLAAMPESADDPAHYVVDPPVAIRSAKQDPSADFIIKLEATLEPGKKYTVTIRNLTSIQGTGVDPDHASKSCTVVL